ncbi:MAG: D-inositol-3-phosphate glycosyltransferase [Bacteroidota bacterium]|jgi:glycosyltransferase involved in cell wall biosynthesis
MKSKKSVYFFVNDFGLTGSETLLAGFINDLSKEANYSLHVIAKSSKGLLTKNLSSNVHFHYLSLEFNFWDKIRAYYKHDIIFNRIKSIFGKHDPDIIYLNTLNNAFLLNHLRKFSSTKILHIHELLMGLNSMHCNDFQMILKDTDEIVACSENVENLYSGIYKKGITRINSVQMYSSKHLPTKTNESRERRIKVVCAGTICYFKGFDYFLEIGKQLDPNKYELLWYGKFDNSAFSEWAKLKLNEPQYRHICVMTLDSQHEYLNELGCADIFVFTSREESMGLVLMDAIHANVPILSMEKNGSRLILNPESNDFFNTEDIPNIENLILRKIHNNSDSKPNSLKFNYREEYKKFKNLLDKY